MHDIAVDVDRNDATPEKITELAAALQGQIGASIGEIGEINTQSRILSMNARIEAARAGQAGRAFEIVGEEMVAFSKRIEKAAQNLQAQTQTLVHELTAVSHALATSVRGTRLADLALANIDVVDRNLYERSCDCRWWATDAAVVNALEDPSDDARIQHACTRLSVILKAYTVYFDIVVADRDGYIIANGRPEQFGSIGSCHEGSEWFESAMRTRSGDEFGFEGVHESTLTNGKRVLVYSCKVCTGGDANGDCLGVIGLVFNWDGLAQKVVEATPIEAEKKDLTRVCLIDGDGRVLADTQGRMLAERLHYLDDSALLTQAKASQTMELNGATHLVSCARSPGFETYRTGWYCVISEKLIVQE